MEKQDVIEFFDRLAPAWDADLVRNEAVIRCILDFAGVRPGAEVLDVACGTGVLLPDYLKRQANVTAIDISPEMARVAAEKFPQARVLCGDAETEVFDRKFDCIVVYNAFPHFPEPERLVRTLAGHLNPGGILTVAHGMSREQLEKHHSGSARRVSVPLVHEDELAAIFSSCLTVTAKISDAQMYLVAGKKE